LSTEADRVQTHVVPCQSVFHPDHMLPQVTEVVLVEEAFVVAEGKVSEVHLVWVGAKTHAIDAEVERRMNWKTLLADMTVTVDQDLLLCLEYFVTENRMLRHQIKGRLYLSDDARKTLAEIGQKLGKQALAEVAKIVKPDTILSWHRTLVAQKFDAPSSARPQGVPRVTRNWRRVWCTWRTSIAAGAMIAWWVPWPTWDTP
jgi:hypothetical protein